MKNGLVIAVLMTALNSYSQNTGIGTTNPVLRLHVSSTTSDNLMLENQNVLDAGVVNAMYFTNAIGGANSFQYAGAIKSIGTGTDQARLGFFTYASNTLSGLKEWLSVSDGGAVGIGNVDPQYSLDVNGSFHSTGSAYFDIGASVGTSLTVGSNLSVGNKITVTGDATVNNGLPVMASGSGTRTKVLAYTATLSVTNLAANSLLGATGTITIGGGIFSGTPTAYVGNVTSENGDYYRAMLILENVTATSVTIRIFNPTSAPITFSNAAWKILVVGPY